MRRRERLQEVSRIEDLSGRNNARGPDPASYETLRRLDYKRRRDRVDITSARHRAAFLAVPPCDHVDEEDRDNARSRPRPSAAVSQDR